MNVDMGMIVEGFKRVIKLSERQEEFNVEVIREIAKLTKRIEKLEKQLK